MTQETLKELFIEQMRDLYDAENQLVEALPKMADAAQTEELAEGLRNHLAETRGHVKRLEQVFQILEEKAERKTCKAMKGLIAEGDEAVNEHEEGELRDLAIIAAAQRVEHYEMSGYGTAKAMAGHLGLDSAVDLLQETEDEEVQADSDLTYVAESLYASAEEDTESEGCEIDEVEIEEEVTPTPTSSSRRK